MGARSGGKRRHVHLAAAFAVHLGLLAALGLGLDDETPPPAPVVILDLTPLAPARPPPGAAEPARRPAARPPAAPPKSAAAPPEAQPSRAPSATAARPIGVRSGSEPVGPTGPIGTQAAIRASSGCDSPDYVRLNPAEAERCEARNRRLWAANPRSYAVISQEKKDFFDGTCKRDDDWCLYRTGQGPYPGLLALGKKKKRSD